MRGSIGIILVLVSASIGCRPSPFRETARLRSPAWVRCVAISPDDSHLAAGTESSGIRPSQQWDGLLRIWDLATGRLLHSLPQDRWVMGVAYSPNGKSLAVGTGTPFNKNANPNVTDFVDKPGFVRIYSVPDYLLQASVQLEKGIVWQLAFLPDSQ